jgi:hypothetical protein
MTWWLVTAKRHGVVVGAAIAAYGDPLWVKCPENEAEQVRHSVRKMMTQLQNSGFPWK